MPQSPSVLIAAKIVKPGIRIGTPPIPYGGENTSSPGAVLTPLDTADITIFRTIYWCLQALKGVNCYSSLIFANHDGTTPIFTEVPNLAPGSGTYDFTTNVDIAAGLMRLTVTPATGGWTFKTRRITQITA